jgi:hypothetical protein
MVTTNSGRRFPRRTVYVATAFTLLAVIAGFGLAASFTVTQGPAITGGGVYHATNSIAWWTEASAGVAVIQTPVPTTLSGTATAPTVLAGAASSYAVAAATANDIGQYWKFTESAGAPISTELEIAFTVSTGATPAVTTTIIFLESQTTSPTGALTFTIFYDLGSPASGTITLNSVSELSQECSAVGTCP